MAKKIETVKPKVTKPAAGKKPPRMSKTEKVRQAWMKTGVANQASRVMGSILSGMKQEYGDANIAPVSEAGRIVIGIPLPSFALEYLLTTTVLPLGRVIQLVGTEGTMKSGFCFETVRWAFERCEGSGFLLENETKFSPIWPRSIIGWDAPPSVLGLVPTTSVEDWQAKLQDFVTRTQKAMVGTKEEPGPGRIWASIIILDSLMGKLSEETIKDIVKTGHAGRHYATEAARITEFLKKFSTDIMEWPLAFIAVNHLKKSKDDMGLPFRGKAGGKHISFQETFELEMSKRPQHKIVIAAKSDHPEIRGRRLNLACFKNSLGEDHRKIDIDVKWWHDRNPETGDMQQMTVWDWFSSTIQLLVTTDWSGGQRKRLHDIVGLERVQKDGQPTRVWSKALGIPKSDPQEFHVAGQAIQRHKVILRGLRQEFGVYSGRRFRPGVDYLTQLERLRGDVEVDIEKAQNVAEQRTQEKSEQAGE